MSELLPRKDDETKRTIPLRPPRPYLIQEKRVSARGEKSREAGETRRTDEIIEPEQGSAELAVVLHDDPDF